MQDEFFANGQWWNKEVIKASVPYSPRMMRAPMPTVENYESITLDLFRKMEVLDYVKLT